MYLILDVSAANIRKRDENYIMKLKTILCLVDSFSYLCGQERINKTMKKYLFVAIITFIAACNSNTQQKVKSASERRAETDTTLIFQGIKIAEPLDSACYAELISNGPIKLYRKDGSSFTFTHLTINDDIIYPGEIVHSLCIEGRIDKFYDFLSFICLYEESYGCFSYYQRLKQNGEKMGTFPIGKVSKLSGKAWTRTDAVSDFVEYGDSPQYKYDFIWEWNNQTIKLSYNPSTTQLNSSVTYFDTGFADREAEEYTQQMLKESEERQVEEARSRQQI